MRRRFLLPALLSATLTAGCGAPERPLDLGFKEVPSDVVLGAQTEATADPRPDSAAPHVTLPPSIVALPPPTFEVGRRPGVTPPPLAACPAGDPLEAPEIEAPTSIDAPPAPGQYLFRNQGTFEVSGPDARRGTFPPTSLRTVQLVSRDDDGRVFEFSVTELLGDITTTTTYRVIRAAEVGGTPSVTADPGLYIRQVDSRGASGESAVFTPTPPLKLAALPLVRGARVEARGVDPTTATTMSFVSTISGKSRVDACGEPLDTFTLELTEGAVLSPEQDLDFAATYALGTQFGGLILREVVAFTGTDGDAGVSRSNSATISQTPRRDLAPRP
ncbi:MAG TPA: hypothetical protein VMY88_12910 [Acidimicrobiales bacterium]|nr:hypothetical protein [Acidimicrobiales bacterium]